MTNDTVHDFRVVGHVSKVGEHSHDGARMDAAMTDLSTHFFAMVDKHGVCPDCLMRQWAIALSVSTIINASITLPKELDDDMLVIALASLVRDELQQARAKQAADQVLGGGSVLHV